MLRPCNYIDKPCKPSLESEVWTKICDESLDSRLEQNNISWVKMTVGCQLPHLASEENGLRELFLQVGLSSQEASKERLLGETSGMLYLMPQQVEHGLGLCLVLKLLAIIYA